MYVITDSKKKADLAKEDYRKIYDQVDVFEYSGEYVVTAANSGRGVVRNKWERGQTAFVWGTIFSEKYFNMELLLSYDNYAQFVGDLKSDKNNFFGHYVVILVDEEEGKIEILSDPVGMINTYYAKGKDGDICISDDLLEVSRLSGNKDLCVQAIYEFLLTESNVGRFTIFKEVFRVGLGKELLFMAGDIIERDIYTYRIENLTKEEYIERLKSYFGYFSRFRGKIAVDLSAGYDTRTVIAIAGKAVWPFMGFTQENEFDDGCDEKISKIIADRMEIPLHCLSWKEERKPNDSDFTAVMRETTVMRNAKRSQKWPINLEVKYNVCDLALGGYGGEVLRAKYNKFSVQKDFVDSYYKGYEAEHICGFANYSDRIMKELEEYRMPENLNRDLTQNWFYAMAKMRIWGSGLIHMTMLYGDVIHPFMDWYLMNPVFGFEAAVLKDAYLQEELIRLFAPELSDIPFNPEKRTVKSVLRGFANSCMNKNTLLRNAGTYLFCEYRNKKEAHSLQTDEIPRELLCDPNIDVQRILTKMGKRIAGRMQTVIKAYEYVRTEEILR